MTDADLTLRDEVAEVLAEHEWGRARYEDYAPPSASISKWGWRCPCGEFVAGPSAHRDHLANALLPLLARVREEGEARVRERVEAVLSDMEPGAIAPIVAIRAALAEEDGQ